MKVQHKQGKIKVSIPFDGEIETDEQGIAEVSQEAGEALTSYEGSLWVNLDASEAEEDVEETDEEENDQNDKEEADDEEIDLDLLDLPSMIEIAQKYEVKGWEKFSKNEKGMRTYLAKKL